MYFKLLCLGLCLISRAHSRSQWSFTSPIQAFSNQFGTYSKETPSQQLVENSNGYQADASADYEHKENHKTEDGVYVVYAEPEGFSYEDEHGGKEKRAIDFKKAWKTMMDSFPPTVHKVIANAEVRYAAEMQGIEPFQYVVPSDYSDQDQYASPLYQTQFSQHGQTSVHKRSTNSAAGLRKRSPQGAQAFDPSQLTRILSKDALTHGATHFAQVKDRGVPARTVDITDNDAPDRKRARRAGDVPTFDPSQLRKILGKSPLTNGATHFNSVEDRGIPSRTVDIRDNKQESERARRAAGDVPTFDPSQLRQILGKSPLTNGATHFNSVEDRGVPSRTVDIRDNHGQESERARRAAGDVPTFDPSQLRQIRGKSPLTNGATYFNSVEDRGIPLKTVDIREESNANPERRRRRAANDAPTFDPVKLRSILGKGPLTEGATHFSRVQDPGVPSRTVDIRDQDSQRQRRATGDVPIFDPSQQRRILGRDPLTGFSQVQDRSGSARTVSINENLGQGTQRRKRQAETFDPNKLRSILGKGTVGGPTHFTQVQNRGAPARTVDIRGDGQQDQTNEGEERLVNPRFSPAPTDKTRVFRRSTKDIVEEYEVQKALEKLDIAGDILENSGDSNEAIAKMIDAEKVLDSALHEVLGNIHDNDLANVEMIDKMLNDSEKPESIEKELMKTMEDAVEGMVEMTKILEDDEDIEKAFQVLIQAENKVDKLIKNVLPESDLEKIAHTRRKRSHGVGYYDPEFQWLMNELDLSKSDQLTLQRLALAEDEEMESSQKPYQSSTSLSYTKPKYKKVSTSKSYTQPSYSSAPSYTTTTIHHGKPTYSKDEYTYTKNPNYQNQGTVTRISDYIQTSAQSLKTPLQKLIDSIRPLQNSIPHEVEAAYQGALEVGKHVTDRVKPIVDTGYNSITYKYIPQARKTVGNAVDSVPDDIKDFARQGRKIVETRARYASTLAKPTLEKLQEDLKILQGQIKQVAEETSEYTKKEVVPQIGPMLRGLIYEAQETLQLANSIVQHDVKPLVEQVLQPASVGVNEYVLKPVTDSVVSYVREPIARTRPLIDERIRPAIDSYVVPAYHSAKGLASSAASGINTVAESSKIIYKDSLEPNLNKFASSTKQVLSHKVKPAVEVAASEVAETFKSEIVPPLRESIQKTLHSVFTGVPFLVKKMSYEAHDAAKVFSGKYAAALKRIKAEAEKQKQEKEAELNMVRQEDQELVKKKLQGIDDEEGSSDDQQETDVEVSTEDEQESKVENEEANLPQETTTAPPSEFAPTQKPKVSLKTSTEL